MGGRPEGIPFNDASLGPNGRRRHDRTPRRRGIVTTAKPYPAFTLRAATISASRSAGVVVFDVFRVRFQVGEEPNRPDQKCVSQAFLSSVHLSFPSLFCPLRCCGEGKWLC